LIKCLIFNGIIDSNKQYAFYELIDIVSRFLSDIPIIFNKTFPTFCSTDTDSEDFYLAIEQASEYILSLEAK
jgi:hypothetical protein